MQRRSAPALTTTRCIWRSFLARVQYIHQPFVRGEAASAGEALESSFYFTLALAFRLSAQYFFIRSETAFFSAAVIDRTRLRAF